MVHGQKFSCALIDKNLPDGSGLDLIRLIRQRQPDCTCLVMTAYPNADSILEALKLGAVDYLEKPFPHVTIIQEKVKAAVDRQRRLASLSSRVAEMNALKAAADAVVAEEPNLQSKLDSVNFRHQRLLTMMREVKAGLESGNANTLNGDGTLRAPMPVRLRLDPGTPDTPNQSLVAFTKDR